MRPSRKPLRGLRSRPSGRRGDLVRPPSPAPLSSERSQEAEGRRKLSVVLHHTKGGYGVCCPSPAAFPAASGGACWSSHGTGWTPPASPREGRTWLREPGLGRPGKARSKKESHFGAPPPGTPARGEREGARLPGPLRAKALGSRAGIPRAACTLQCWRETFQRETRACKLNGEFASRSLQTLVPPPSPSTLPSPQTRETPKTDTG